METNQNSSQAGGNTGPINAGLTKKSSKGNVPASQVDLAEVGVNVINYWATVPALTLLYITQPNAKIKAVDFQTKIQNLLQNKWSRSPVTSELQIADKLANKAVGKVKKYIGAKYDDDDDTAVSHYPEFGIEKVGSAYKLPVDRQSRKVALQLMVDACTAAGFMTQTYGASFWGTFKANYETLLTSAGSIDGTTSSGVGSKNVMMKELKTILNSLIFIIKGNYPDTYKGELRSWGFQKEKY